MSKEFYTHHQKLTQDQKAQIVEYLCKDRLENYGYDTETFKKMQSERAQLKKILRWSDVDQLNWQELNLSRFQWEEESPKGKLLHYIVGQSRNEEITNLIRCLLGSNILVYAWQTRHRKKLAHDYIWRILNNPCLN